jgi:hypothetical protein
MSDVCDMLAMLKQRPQAVAPDEVEALLAAAGFARKALPERPIPLYSHPQLPGERFTVKIDVAGYVSASAVEEALSAVSAVVVCDER